MQHYKYATLKKLHINPDLSYLKQFLKANIKFLFTYPKSIWYSQRYNAGEKFILMNKNIYPYFYNTTQNKREANDLLNISLYLVTSATESYIMNYPNLKPNTFSEKTRKEVYDKFIESFQTLNTLINVRIEDQDKLDLPVAFYARVLYAGVVANSLSVADPNTKNSISEEAYRLCLGKFLEKIEFADAESIALSMFSLANFGVFEENVWRTLIEHLKAKSFAPEFTYVSNKAPHVFRYEEVDTKEIKSQYLDDFGNKLFVNGYLPVFLAYSALNKAVKKGVNVGDMIVEIEKRFPEVREEVNLFNASI